MSTEFKVGDRVKCINIEKLAPGKNLKKNEIYTISEIRLSPMGSIKLKLKDLNSSATDLGYYAERFELIKETIDFTKPLQTKAGETVTVLLTNGRGRYPVVGYLGDSVNIVNWTVEGRWSIDHESEFDLMNVLEKPKQMVLYVNLYESGIGAHISYSTRKAADDSAGLGRIGCKRIVLTEGEWDE